VLGSDAVPAAWWMSLDAMLRVGGLRAAFEAADDLMVTLRCVKSLAEQRLLRAAGALGSQGMIAAPP
jgi:Xaa-Pro aminopeptidase